MAPDFFAHDGSKSDVEETSARFTQRIIGIFYFQIITIGPKEDQLKLFLEAKRYTE